MSDPGPEREPVTPWRTITLVIALLLSLAACPCLCAGTPSEADPWDSERLLDELVAGSDANFELIDHGLATYEVHVDYKNPTGEHTDTWVYTVQFDYPLLRVELPEEIAIHKPDAVIIYSTHMGPEAEPLEHRAVIQDPAVASPPPFHPRIQRRPGRATHVGPTITPARERARAAGSDESITAKRSADGSIELRYEHPTQYYRMRFIVSPQLGYSLTRTEEYALKASDSVPYEEATMSYRRLPSGAYIVEEQRRVSRVWEDGAYRYITEAVTRLVDFDPARPSPDVFRLESMGIPVGARIEDQINQRHYIFGVTAVTEEDIGAVEVTGAWRGTAPRRVLVIGTVVIGLVVLWFGVIRRRFRRQGSG